VNTNDHDALTRLVREASGHLHDPWALAGDLGWETIATGRHRASYLTGIERFPVAELLADPDSANLRHVALHAEGGPPTRVAEMSALFGTFRDGGLRHGGPHSWYQLSDEPGTPAICSLLLECDPGSPDGPVQLFTVSLAPRAPSG